MDRLLVVGSRGVSDWDIVRQSLEQSFNLDVQLITAGTRGAEKMAGYVWAEWGGDSREYAPNWDTHGKSAGYRRVEGLILARPVRLIAFIMGDDPMVAHAIEFAMSKDVPVTVIHVPVKDEQPATASDNTAEPAPF